MGLLTAELAGAAEDGKKHGAGELAGVGVLQGWMIAGDEGERAGQCVLGGVAEDEAGAGRDLAGAELVAEEAVKGDLAQADDDAQVVEQAEFLVEPGRAITQLLGSGFVGRRGAMSDGGDPEAAEFHAVVAGDGPGLRGKTGLMEDGIEKVA